MAHIDAQQLLEKVRTEEDHLAFAKYLARLVTRLDQELIALLFSFFRNESRVIYGGKLIKADELIVRSRTAFDLFTDGMNIPVRPDTIHRFTILEPDRAVAPGYTTLYELRQEIGSLKAQLGEKAAKKKASRLHRLRLGLRGLVVDENSFGVEQMVQEACKNDPMYPQQGFGAYAPHYAAQYLAKRNRDLKAGLYGAAASFSLLSLLYAVMPKPVPHGIGNPTTSGSSPIPDGMTDEDGNVRWSPDGKPMPKPGEREKEKTSKDLQDLQEKFLGKGDPSPPRRMRDIREPYLKLTTDLDVRPIFPRQGLVDPQGHFPPRRNIVYPVADEAKEIPTPEMPVSDASVFIVYDVSRSMQDPEKILGTPSEPSWGHALAYQLIKSYGRMGYTIRIMRYPLDVVDESNILQTASIDAALAELDFSDAGTANDQDAVMAAATLYITYANRIGLGPMPLIWITDEGPTQSMPDAMNLELHNRDKDFFHWVNTRPGYQHAETAIKDSVRGHQRRAYHSVTSQNEVHAVAKKILEQKP